MLTHSGRVLGVDEGPTEPPDHDCAGEGAGGGDEESPAVPVGHAHDRRASRALSRIGRPTAFRGARHEAHEDGQHGATEDDGHDGVEQGQRRLDERLAQCGRERDGAERREDCPAEPEPAAGDDAGGRRDGNGGDHDQAIEGGLVVRAEDVDKDLLGARRLETDDERPDGDDERGRAGRNAGEQLRAGDRDAAGHGAGQGQRSGPADLDAPAGDWAGGIDPTDLRGSGACHAAEPRGDV